MFVVKRDGSSEKIYFDKITARNMKLMADLDVDSESLSQDVIKGLQSGMTTREIDILSCENAIVKSVYEPQYAILAIRIAVNDLHKSTPSTFRECIEMMKDILREEVYEFTIKNIEIIEKSIDYNRDYNLSYFGFKNLEYSYLYKINKKIIERPQYFWMRVSLGIHASLNNDSCLDKVLETYNRMSNLQFTHATPTLFNSGFKNGQLSSCFLLSCDDSIEGITDSWKDCSMVSKNSGGIGVDITSVRGDGSVIGINGKSGGIIPFIKVFNEIARAIDQGGKRKGAFSMYLQPWHPDILDFLILKKNTTIEERRALDIHFALWIPDILFKRIEMFSQDSNIKWSLFCPKKYPELITLHGEEFEKRYLELENEKKYERQILVEKLWKEICSSLEETGEPYMMSKDNVNRKNNQMNIGSITGSNLCAEIVEYHDSESIASCNLASIGLSSFVKDDKFNFEDLGKVASILCENLNRVIDVNYVPTKRAIENNRDYRPIGIGLQGLADVFIKLRLSWDSEQALRVNQVISEVIYFYALSKSCELAQRDGKYFGFDGSPASKGILQFDFSKIVPITLNDNEFIKLDWESLKKDIIKHGLRNSLLTCCMPTGSTSQILGNIECIEPITSNIYIRNVLSGAYPMVNNYLYNDLTKLGIWNRQFVDELIRNNGDLENMNVPQEIKDVYRNVWNIKQKRIIDMASARGNFIDQSQSMNIYLQRPTVRKLTSLYIDGWKKGLKTLSYYLRSQPAVDAVKFSIEKGTSVNEKKVVNGKVWVCDDGSCCSS